MAAKKILTPYDFQQNEIQNARIQNLGSAPGSPVEGQIYWDTATHTAQVRNNSAFFGLLDGGAVAQSKTGQLTLTGGLVVNTTGITGNQTIALTGTGASSRPCSIRRSSSATSRTPVWTRCVPPT